MSIPISDYIALLATYLRQQRRQVWLLSLLIFEAVILQLVPPQLLRSFIDAIKENESLNTLINLALLFISLVLVQQVVSIFVLYLTEDIAWRATNQLRIDLAIHCLNLDMRFHNQHAPGEMIERLDGDITVLSNFFSQFLIAILSNIILVIGILILLFQVHILIGTLTIGFVLITLFVLLQLRNVSVPYSVATRQSYANFYSYLEERLAGTEEIRANGVRAYIMRRFYDLLRDVKRKELKEQWMHGFVYGSMALLASGGNVLALGLIAYTFQTDNLTLGTAYLVFHYSTMLSGPLNTITRQVEDLQRASASIARLQELQKFESNIIDVERDVASKPATIQSLSTEQPAKRCPLAVKFDNVSFSYDQQMLVLQEITFQLTPGTVLGLLGRTGSGKTTLTRLLFRFYDPNTGSISLGPPWQDIRDVPLRDLRHQVGLVTQNVELFQASLRDNLTFWDDTISDGQIIAALQDLGLGVWYETLPYGLDTPLQTSGSDLSAGEAQLLAFTRIFLRDPSLIILDEASSRLDPATEQQLERAINKLLQGRTAIVIAHRLSTVQRADEILILEDGQIHEHGQRTALIQDPSSYFYQLSRTDLMEVLV